MRVAIVGAPLALGQTKPGVGLAPETLRRAGLAETISQLGFSVTDAGDVELPKAKERQAEIVVPDHNEQLFGRNIYQEGDTTLTTITAAVTRVKHAEEVGESCRLIAEKVAECARSGDFVLTLGGDHSIAMGTIPGILDARPETSLIWVDAHGDFNTPETSPSGNLHGMPLAMLLGYTGNLPGFEWLNPQVLKRLPPNRVALVGIRSLDAGERKLIKEAGIHVYTMSDIDRYGIGTVMERAIADIGSDNNRTFHVSFDIDSLDPSEAPGTGTLVKGGLTYREAHAILEMLAATGRLTSMDLAEVNPELDQNGQTTALGVELVSSALGKAIF